MARKPRNFKITATQRLDGKPHRRWEGDWRQSTSEGFDKCWSELIEMFDRIVEQSQRHKNGLTGTQMVGWERQADGTWKEIRNLTIGH